MSKDRKGTRNKAMHAGTQVDGAREPTHEPFHEQTENTFVVTSCGYCAASDLPEQGEDGVCCRSVARISARTVFSILQGSGLDDAASTARYRLVTWSNPRLHSNRCRWQPRCRCVRHVGRDTAVTTDFRTIRSQLDLALYLIHSLHVDQSSGSWSRTILHMSSGRSWASWTRQVLA